MKSISIFGLGYVGAVTAACLASRGNKVIGVDPNPLKVEKIRAGKSPIVEKDVQEMIATALRSGQISATNDPRAAVEDSDISFVSVGTQGQRNGKPDLSHVRAVCEEIGDAIRCKSRRHCVVIRSTVLPGTTEHVIIPAIEAASGMKAGRDFSVCFNPEFLREGSAVADFFSPPFTVIGADDSYGAGVLRELYGFLSAPMYCTSIPSAEMIKYACNAFHALKVAFANEIGTMCNAMGIDATVVSDILKSDTRLNASPAYLTPGFAFGGSCLPKDLRALVHKSRELDLRLPVIESILPSNIEHIQRAFDDILSLGKRRIGVIGLSFKPGTDDLRESPAVYLVKKLIAEGYDIRIWDDHVALGRLIGSNRQFIEEYIPHIGLLLRDAVDEVIEHAQVVVLANKSISPDQVRRLLSGGQFLVDLAHLQPPVQISDAALATAATG